MFHSSLVLCNVLVFKEVAKGWPAGCVLTRDTPTKLATHKARDEARLEQLTHDSSAKSPRERDTLVFGISGSFRGHGCLRSDQKRQERQYPFEIGHALQAYREG